MIELSSVCKSFKFKGRSIPVLHDVNLQVQKGEAFCIYGKSGSGKTTLLNIIGGMLAPTSGTVGINDTDISRLPLHFLSTFRRNHIGFIFQQFNLLERYTVLENVLFPLLPMGKPLEPERQRAEALLERLGIGHRVDFPVRYLSGGEQQRVAVARALICDPLIIIADEPFSNLDAENNNIILDIFKGLKEQRKTLVLSSTASCAGPETEIVDRSMVQGC